MSEIIWTDRAPGQRVSIVDSDLGDGGAVLIIGEIGVGDLLRIPANFSDARYAGQSFPIQEVVTIDCPVSNHQHSVIAYLLLHKLIVIECPCVGQVFWGFNEA